MVMLVDVMTLLRCLFNPGCSGAYSPPPQMVRDRFVTTNRVLVYLGRPTPGPGQVCGLMRTAKGKKPKKAKMIWGPHHEKNLGNRGDSQSDFSAAMNKAFEWRRKPRKFVS